MSASPIRKYRKDFAWMIKKNNDVKPFHVCKFETFLGEHVFSKCLFQFRVWVRKISKSIMSCKLVKGHIKRSNPSHTIGIVDFV